jgi:kynurenine formamidase
MESIRKMRFIDLSVTIRNQSFEPGGPEIVRMDHKEAARRRAADFNFLPSGYPDSMAMAHERVTLSAHGGTHVDAPVHYGPLCEGKPAKSIEYVPLEWCYGPGVVLDVSHKKPAEYITKADVIAAAEKIPHKLAPKEIVLLRTDAAKHFDNPAFPNLQPGLHPDACHWILDQGVRMIGIDAWGLDRPPKAMADDHKKGIPNSLWPSHLVGRDREYLQIERLANLDALPPTGFTVVAFPVKIEHGTAGWSRVVALIED